MSHRTHFNAIWRLFILYIASVISAEIAWLELRQTSSAEGFPMFIPSADYTINYNADENDDCSMNCTSTPTTTGRSILYKVGNTLVCSLAAECRTRLKFEECMKVDIHRTGYFIDCLKPSDAKICQNGELRDERKFQLFAESVLYKCDCSGSPIDNSFCENSDQTVVISAETGPGRTSTAATNTGYTTPATTTSTSTTATSFSAHHQFNSTPTAGPADEEPTRTSMDRSTVIYIGVASGAVLLIVIAVVIIVVLRRRRAAAHTPTAVRSTQSERGFGYHDGYEDCDLDVVNPQSSRNGSADRRVSSTSVDYDTAWHLPTNNSGQHPAPDLSQLYTTVNKPKKWKNENENANDSEYKRLVHQPESTSNEEDRGDTSDGANAAIPEVELVDNEIYGS